MEIVAQQAAFGQLEREVGELRAQLREALDNGALGLSTGLAYLSANAATTEEVAALVAFVCSPLASAINGAALRVDGGVVRSIA